MAMDQQDGQESLRLSFVDGTPLRYGENPHQKAWAYRLASSGTPFVALQGKELSYNNYLDLEAAVETVAELARPACAVVKHTNPCGISEGDSVEKLLETSWEGDPTSAFGSIIAFNRPVGGKDLLFLDLDHADKSRRKFVEIVVAPEFSQEALSYLAHATNLRAVVHSRGAPATGSDLRLMDGVLLRQDRDSTLLESLSSKTGRPVEPSLSELIRFGTNAARQVKSNAIVIVRALPEGAFQLLGMGSGQPNRVDSVRLAVRKSRENLEREAAATGSEAASHVAGELARAVLVSDAFFPFPDSMDVCAEAGIRTIVQPGGSVRDQTVIRRCDELGLAMAFTGCRHFRH
jgi:phosphoribosylaminoimidazolecarboxamide formyltransferase / IMP cyclohydrolase